MEKKKLLQIIEQAVKEKSTELDLSRNQLTSLPPETGKLANLTQLDLSRNQLTSLPPEIGKLANLTGLGLNENQLLSLPPEIGKLANLARLYINENQLSSLPPEIGKLANLTGLGLSRNQLLSLPPEIGKLANLTLLCLNENQLTSLPPEIGKLANLTQLSLNKNQLSSLPLEINKLANLARLYLHGNRLSSLPPEIGKLANLTQLNLERNQLLSLPPEIGKLANLAGLYIERNQLSSLPLEIGKLINLTKLEIRENPLPIPPEILNKYKEPATIINFYQTDKKIPLNEAKMMLVGQGSVGKTSLARQLTEGKFDPHENKTEGINIEKWRIRVDKQEILLNVWDFGGQEIMHATHQFFLTKRSLYLLVLDSRLGKEENRLEYWLKIIQSFGGDSPVIVVGNKTDQQAFDTDRRGLHNKYENIRAFVGTSCKTGHGIDELKNLIDREIGDLDHISDMLPNTWFTVKDRLEKMEHNYMQYQEYVDLCEKENISDSLDQHTLIGFLNDLGIVLNFQDDPRLEDTNILNPEWVTKGVYKILNSNELFHSKGILEREMLNRILDTLEYPRDKHMFITDMMRKFELCFDFEGFADKKFLIPDLLSEEESYTGDWQDALVFQYHYNVLPGSIISRFIVRMHKYIYQNTYWRSGVVLMDQKNKALVRADSEDKRIFIRVRGSQQSRRIFLSVIRSHFDTIHGTISKIEAREKVPVPDHPDIAVDYKHLQILEAKGISSFIPERLEHEVSVRQLLDGVRTEQPENIKSESDNTDTGPTCIRTNLWEKIGAFAFGIIFIVTMLIIAAIFPEPTDFQIFIFRVVLALAASGIGAVMPGFLHVEWDQKYLPYIRAGGAIALFVIVYLVNPPGLI